MAAPNYSEIFRVPGVVEFGGTALGATRQKVLRPFRDRYNVTAEEFGGELVEQLNLGFNWVFACIFRQYDADAVSAVFPNTTGSRIDHPGSAGPLRSADAGQLIFRPDDARWPGFIMYNAIPEVDEAAEMNFALNSNFEFAAIFSGIRDSSGRVIRIDAPFSDLGV